MDKAFETLCAIGMSHRAIVRPKLLKALVKQREVLPLLTNGDIHAHIRSPKGIPRELSAGRQTVLQGAVWILLKHWGGYLEDHSIFKGLP